MAGIDTGSGRPEAREFFLGSVAGNCSGVDIVDGVADKQVFECPVAFRSGTDPVRNVTVKSKGRIPGNLVSSAD